MFSKPGFLCRVKLILCSKSGYKRLYSIFFTDSAVKDCTYVIHVASPFPAENPRDEMEVIGPAVDGTKNVLEACAKTKGGVKRVVLTSSSVAIYGKGARKSYELRGTDNYFLRVVRSRGNNFLGPHVFFSQLSFFCLQKREDT